MFSILVLVRDNNSVMDAENGWTTKLYLNYTNGSVHVFLFVWISWFSPVRVYCDANNATLFCTILVIIHMPGLSMSLEKVVSHNIWCSAGIRTYTWTEIEHKEFYNALLTVNTEADKRNHMYKKQKYNFLYKSYLVQKFHGHIHAVQQCRVHL